MASRASGPPQFPVTIRNQANRSHHTIPCKQGACATRHMISTCLFNTVLDVLASRFGLGLEFLEGAQLGWRPAVKYAKLRSGPAVVPPRIAPVALPGRSRRFAPGARTRTRTGANSDKKQVANGRSLQCPGAGAPRWTKERLRTRQSAVEVCAVHFLMGRRFLLAFCFARFSRRIVWCV